MTTPERFCDVRTTTESLASRLSAEDQVVQSMPDASPAKWHRAHTTWFFEEFVLGSSVPDHSPVDPSYRYLFNSYYEAVGDRQPRPRRGMITRPSVTEVARYREAVDASMLAALRSGELDSAALALVELGLHHEQQHQELMLMDVLHLLAQNPTHPAYSPAVAPAPATATESGWISHPGGTVEVGHPGGSFSFDNEGPRHTAQLVAFELADRLVTNADWLAFIADGGYSRPELWLSDGWHLACEQRWEAPLYWSRSSAGEPWSQFGLHGLRPVDPHEPVCHVSYHEADAFARWAGARLPTELEWEAVAARHWAPPQRRDRPQLHVNPAGTPGADPLQLTGEVWQWTASAYLPYPGFAPAPGAVGEYNGKFMVNQHVLRGGACVTPPGHERVTYRNFYPPSARWPFTGVRIARDT